MNRILQSLVAAVGGLLISGAMPSTANAALIAYEGFDFEGGQINGKGSGFGFSGNWINTSAPFLNVSNDNVSLDSPAFPFDPVGNRVESTGGATRRVLANTYDLSQDGAPFYLSFLLRKSDVGVIAATNVEVALWQGTTSAIMRVGSSSSNAGPNANQSLFFSSVPGGGTVNSAIPVVYSDTYFLVVKGVPSAAGDDQLFASIYDPSDTVPLTEPGAWDISRTFNSAVTLSQLRVTLGNSAAGSVDEIRIGDSWESVTIPEPSAPLLVVLIGVVRGCVRRRTVGNS